MLDRILVRREQDTYRSSIGIISMEWYFALAINTNTIVATDTPKSSSFGARLCNLTPHFSDTSHLYHALCIED